jgi:hypothetical protein
MGYRSQVAYVISFDDKQTLNEFIAKIMVLGGHVCDALKECQIEVVEGMLNCYRINFFASDVKWYDTFPEVEGHNMLRELAEEWYSGKSASRFIRIGEEHGDIDEQTEGDSADLYDDFYTYTHMELPFDKDYEPIGDNLRIIDDGVKV